MPRYEMVPGGFTMRQVLSDEERAALDARIAARNAEIRKSSMLLIGRDEHGNPLPASDAGEEERLRSTDLRAVLAWSQVERDEIALRLADQRGAAGRAKAHHEAVTAELAALEDKRAANEHAAADDLAARFRSGAAEADVIALPRSDLDQSRRAVEVARQAVDTLAGEVESTERDLDAAQHKVSLAVLDVVRGELLRLGREATAHDQAAQQIRADLAEAGYVTANLRQRHHWPANIFTSSTSDAMNYRPPDRASAASVDWAGFIARLDEDTAAVL
jgi:hypothetical protein